MTDKKKLFSLGALVLVLALFLTAFLIMKNKNKNSETETEETQANTTVTVTSKVSDEMKHISYVCGDSSYSFTRNTDTTWSLDSDSFFPVKSNTVNTMATVISSITAERLVENGDVDAFGFDAPEVTVKGEYTNGEKIEFIFGKTSDFNGLVYLKDVVNEKIYMVKETVMSPFKVDPSELITRDSLPSGIDEEFINGLTVTDETGTSNTITGEFGMDLTEALEYFYKLEFPAKFCLYAPEQSLAGYGIGKSKASALLSYKGSDGKDETFEIIFGDCWVLKENLEDEDGEPYVKETVYYYYTTPGSRIVYSIIEDDYEALMGYVNCISQYETEAADTAE